MAGRWFSPCTPVSSTNKTDHHDIAEILLKVELNTIPLSPHTYSLWGTRLLSSLNYNSNCEIKNINKRLGSLNLIFFLIFIWIFCRVYLHPNPFLLNCIELLQVFTTCFQIPVIISFVKKESMYISFLWFRKI